MTAPSERHKSPLEKLVRIGRALAASDDQTRNAAADQLLGSSSPLTMIDDVAILLVVSVRVLRRLRLLLRDLDTIGHLLRQHVLLEIGEGVTAATGGEEQHEGTAAVSPVLRRVSPPRPTGRG
jgi:hypothetical protein